jgi:hypothetical protein
MRAKDVLTLLTDYQVFSIYLGDFELDKKMFSPFRDEDTPSFVITDKFGSLKWYDFGDSSDHKKDCIGFVQKLYNISYDDAVLRIFSDRLGASNIPKPKKKNKSNDKPWYKTGEWLDFELEFWGSKKISVKELREVLPCRGMGYKDYSLFESTKDSPAFIYRYSEDSWRTYRPLESKKIKFRNFNTENILEGYNTLPSSSETLIIASSNKDAMTLRTAGYNSISPVGEANIQPLLNRYSDLSLRFRDIFVLLDRDETGVNITRKLCSLTGWKPIWMDYEKDPSDLVCKYSYLPLHSIIDRHTRRERENNYHKNLISFI